MELYSLLVIISQKQSLVKSVDEEGNAIVLWPRKGQKPDIWKGTVK